MQLMYMHLAKSANPLDAVYGPDLSCTVPPWFQIGGPPKAIALESSPPRIYMEFTGALQNK